MAEIKAALLPIRRGYEAPKETVNNFSAKTRPANCRPGTHDRNYKIRE